MEQLKRRCVVKGCRRDREGVKKAHRFPNPKLRFDMYKKWVELLGIEKYKCMDPNIVYQNVRVCSAHFVSENFTCTKKLKDDALPILNLNKVPDRSPIEKHQENITNASNQNYVDSHETREQIEEELADYLKRREALFEDSMNPDMATVNKVIDKFCSSVDGYDPKKEEEIEKKRITYIKKPLQRSQKMKEGTDMESSCADFVDDTSEPPSKRYRFDQLRHKREIIDRCNSSLSDLVQSVLRRRNSKDNHIDYFFSQIASEVKKFSSANQELVQRRVLSLVRDIKCQKPEGGRTLKTY